MEMEVTSKPSQRMDASTSESLRQRQRDKLTPRQRGSKEHRKSSIPLKEVKKEKSSQAVKSGSKPKKKEDGRTSPERKPKKQTALREDANGKRYAAKGSVGELSVNVTPEITSAGREGRQFTVSNVGNNGRIYLRYDNTGVTNASPRCKEPSIPTVRAANQRYPQPQFVFPATPPSSVALEDHAARNNNDDESQRDSLWTTRSPPVTSMARAADQPPLPRIPISDSNGFHKRSFSHSTFDDQFSSQGFDAGAFKVVIERPGTERPKSAKDDSGLFPSLEVPIPSWRLGTPRFSVRGTAFLRGSSYAPTEDMRSSAYSSKHRETSRETSLHGRSTLGVDKRTTRRHSHASPQPRFIRVDTSDIPDTPALPSPSVLEIRPRVIEPSMFDELTFKPACDDRALVRYSAQTGGITAATPPRLIAEITSQTFLDYDLLSDFFLTYRSFLTPSDLLAMLVARLRWALARSDEIGMVVRVRTFVALRHWVLNYFMDDFVTDFDLRKNFCNLINTFVDEILKKEDAEKNQVKILGELKKCWRRTCALYWDGSDFTAGASQETPIAPGGVAGSRDPNLTPEYWGIHSEAGPPRLDNIFDHDNTHNEGYNFFADVSRAGYVDAIKPYVRPESGLEDEQVEVPLSPSSIMSEEVISCSFPSRSRVGNLEAAHLGPHPVATSPTYGRISPLTYTKSLSSKQRPVHTHRRSGSFSDSLRLRAGRQADQPSPSTLSKSTELLMSVPYAGSLVRGNLFPPGQAFVEIVKPATPAEAMRATTYFQKQEVTEQRPSAMSAPGMKKLLGSVRRALGSKLNASLSQNTSPTQGAFPSIPRVGVKGATVRLPGTAVVPQARPQRAPMRIDLLGAGIAEDFKKAVREDAEAEAFRQESSANGSIGKASGGSDNALSLRRGLNEASIPYRDRAPVSGITAGSKSIVIVDDTSGTPVPIMTGALPVNPSTDTITDPYMAPVRGLTPPSTPPEEHTGSPRRSSHLLGASAVTRDGSVSLERTPSLVNNPNEASVVDLSPTLPKSLPLRPSMHHYGRSKRSVSLRRYASFQSGFVRHATERSFDATTFSDSVDRDSSIPVPAPLHVLRRRPGGNLRGANNVGDLNLGSLRRARSFGSIDTYSDSVRSSYLLGRDSSQYIAPSTSDDYSATNPATFSLGALAEQTPKRQVSLFSTHSSQPPMRPSFEKEAAKLAQIPDDVDDDGGVESALLKLEGKFDEARRSRASDLTMDSPTLSLHSLGAEALEAVRAHDHDGSARKTRREGVVDSTFATATSPEVYRPRQTSAEQQPLKPAVYQPRQLQPPNQAMETKRSAESYSSIPLLQRDSSYDELRNKSQNIWTDSSVLRDVGQEGRTHGQPTPDSSHNSYDFIIETESLKRVRVREHNRSDSHGDSFLDSDSDAESDLSSEMSMEPIPASASKATFPPMAGATLTEIVLPPGPLRVPSSPSMSMRQALVIEPQLASPQLYLEQLRQGGPGKVLPPTPQITPTIAKPAKEGNWDGDEYVPPSLTTVQPTQASRQSSVHLPFVLAFDSQVLAQQFTLVEKDALNEIDWKDLIDMRWRNTTSNSRSWVDFLRTQDARGVEVVISRFNIVCKWAVSEVVLTRNIEERVQCIIKYIHIAAHCRSYRNYATLYQIVVALTNTEITRLKTTWSHVPASDNNTLKELETLVQPMKNFHNLRAEMEGSGAGSGCIPFIGVYTHDLLFNSQRPSAIAGTPTSEPLVNFERCRTSAAIVKNLLRLLEASQLYTFRPIEGVTERCLWMAALSDAEIRKLGDGIE